MSRSESLQGSKNGVLIVGSISVDLTTFSGRLPARGETILGDDFTMVLGGKGANQAVAAALAGGDAHMVGCIGTDLFAELAAMGLRDAGVNIEQVRRVDGSTGIAHIRVDSSGENDIIVVPLANSALGTKELDAAFEADAGRSSVMLTQLEIPWSVTQYAIRKAHAAGLTVVLDPAPAVALDESIWPLIDIVTPNETEASILTGITVTDEASAIEAGRWFIARGSSYALITMAAAGAVLVSRRDVELFDAFSVTAIDTTAAGDAFAGYLGASLAGGFSLHDAIRKAIAAGAITVTRRGASPSMPTAAEVSALLDSEESS